MREYLSKFFSIVFIPLLIPIYSALLLVWCNKFAFGGWNASIDFLFRIFRWTFLIPGIAILIMKGLNMIGDVNMSNRKDRIIPYFMIIICYSIAFIEVRYLQIPPIIKAMIIGSLGSIILSFFLNNFFKVSAHANGMGSFLGAMVGLLTLSSSNVDWIIIPAVILSGIVAASRIYLKAHTLKEVFTGFAIGFGAQLLAFIVFGVFKVV